MVLGTVAVAAFAVMSARLFVWPAADAPRAADAVVLFAGGTGERLALAERLMAAGTAPNLVIPNGMAPEWPAGNRACTGDLPSRFTARNPTRTPLAEKPAPSPTWPGRRAGDA
jgi:hypothetical protein